MPTINLRKYYPFLTEDRLVEVSDEIAEAFLLEKRQEDMPTAPTNGKHIPQYTCFPI